MNRVTLYDPLENWNLSNLEQYMAWKIIEGMTQGKPIKNVVSEFPLLILEWDKLRNEQT